MPKYRVTIKGKTRGEFNHDADPGDAAAVSQLVRDLAAEHKVPAREVTVSTMVRGRRETYRAS